MSNSSLAVKWLLRLDTLMGGVGWRTYLKTFSCRVFLPSSDFAPKLLRFLLFPYAFRLSDKEKNAEWSFKITDDSLNYLLFDKKRGITFLNVPHSLEPAR